ncbi:MAG TPA: GNAT family N-acetyltransferase [Marmoricola sp.]|nr:N-acetyltransferase [Nocardioidaceae bacterium]MCO5323995.1 N-acetyltransferase [Nocardioidaceae bacterium]HMU36316.1 GNAT family N-acetyltransferase [Marmoricola sp.]HRV68299.1 GNAT family N-acetyltransferase [Marmoricola sp.]
MGEQLTTTHNEQASRFEAHLGEQLASYLEYQLTGDVYDMDHTVTLDAFKGRGIASTLTEFALAHVRREGGQVIPTCWFIREYFEKHPDQADLVHDAGHIPPAQGGHLS